MDIFNALENQNYKPDFFTKELLTEAEDIELQTIVEKAAKELKSPMALVSLLLDQIQFFKAHVGLPEVLKESRGTRRDASFCQFVVRDGVTFEVNDGSNDPRIPQHVVKEFNIQAYLGVPIKVNDQVVGSLCVLDTKKRQFTQTDHENLNKLSKLVNKRLDELTRSRRAMRIELTQKTLNPAFTEISSSLAEILERINEGYSNIATINTFLKTWAVEKRENSFNRKPQSESSYEIANEARQKLEDDLLEMEMSILNGLDSLKALNRLTSFQENISLSEIITSAQDLTRKSTKEVGGFPLPSFPVDPIIYTKTDLVVALIANTLLLLSEQIKINGGAGGIRLRIEVPEDEFVSLKFSTKVLDQTAIKLVEKSLLKVVSSQHPTVKIKADSAYLKIELKVNPE